MEVLFPSKRTMFVFVCVLFIPIYCRKTLHIRNKRQIWTGECHSEL
jgi:hypothetical protein